MIHETLLSLLTDISLIKSGGVIDGHWFEPRENTFAVVNPATGEELAVLANMDAREVRAAIDSAYKAQKKWAATSGKQRAAVLRSLHELVLANADDLAAILTMEMGKPLAEAKGEVLYAASYIEWFAEEAKRVYGDIVPAPEADKRIAVIKQPVGVVGMITPWNFPIAMLARKLAPALAVGCAAIAKPAADTPMSAIALAVLAERAGLPVGVFNLLTSTHDASIGELMCGSDKLRKISFTGSTEVGRILMRQCADKVLRMSMELGGNAPFIVFDDADVDMAVEGAMASKYRNAGQTCVCANRFFVQAGIYDEFAAKLSAKVGQLTLGNGLSEDVTTGPLINAEALCKVDRLVADAVTKGATVLLGGHRSKVGPLFFQPTVLGDVTPTMKVMEEEIFGPVAPLCKFDSVVEVIGLANDTDSGLAAYFYSRDISKIWRVAEALEYGMVGVNTGVISTEVAPFGGVKQSGQGREGSMYGVDDYLEMKYICVGGV